MDMPHPYDDYATAWLSTTASQIFVMQIGFLCFEVGFVKPVWTESIILKNIEDTFVAIFTYLAITYTLSQSPRSIYGIISIPENPLLIGVDSDIHDQVFIGSLFAATAATIISGAVLQRMKNKVYVLYTFLLVLINYSFVSHWVWHENGWLNELGFTDGAGAMVVHSTAGIASAVAIWKLGPRKSAIGKDGKLLPIEPAVRPIISAIGVYFLWYGWFAFNVASPIAYNRGVGDAIGTTALVTVVSPICSAGAGFILVRLGWIDFTFEGLLSCILAGLVGITGGCHSCNIIESGVIGFFSSIVYFVMSRIIRNKLQIDDPLEVTAIHFGCGIWSCLAEGLFANGVYGTKGLIYGDYEHFGVQCLGTIVICAFNSCLCWLLYILLEKVIYRKTTIRVTILDTYLGKKLFTQNIDSALNEVLKCDSNTGRRMLWLFYKYMCDRFALEQLDFLIVIQIFNNILENKNTRNSQNIARYILKIMDTYIRENAICAINVSGQERAILLRMKGQLMEELAATKNINNEQKNDNINNETEQKSDTLYKYRNGTYKSTIDITKESIFEVAYMSVWRIVQPHFTQFLLRSFEPPKRPKIHNVRIPFKLNDDWTLEWDSRLLKQKSTQELIDTLPSASLLTEMEIMNQSKSSIGTVQSMGSLREMVNRNVQFQIVDTDDNCTTDNTDNATVTTPIISG
eukprot:507869_1